jgi:hypothetical protein
MILGQALAAFQAFSLRTEGSTKLRILGRFFQNWSFGKTSSVV